MKKPPLFLEGPSRNVSLPSVVESFLGQREA